MRPEAFRFYSERGRVFRLLFGDRVLELLACGVDLLFFRFAYAFPADALGRLPGPGEGRRVRAAGLVQQQPTRYHDLLIQVRGKFRVILRNGIPHALEPVGRRRERLAVAPEQLCHGGRIRKRFRRGLVLFHGVPEPWERLRLGECKIVNAEDQLRRALLVAAERVHKRSKSATFVRIAILCDLVPGLLFHHEGFRLVRHAEGRVEPGLLEMAAQHLRAEGMQRGDVRARCVPGGGV